MYAVEKIDYQGLVNQMASVGMKEMSEVLFKKLGELDPPKMKNEVIYFWNSLFNAAKSNDGVWLWLCTAPHIRRFAPPEAEFHTMPCFASDLPLPIIGGPDDEPFQPSEGPKQYSAEPTEGNLLEQAAMLDAHLRIEGEENPTNRCKTVEEYVATFYYSGTGQMSAQVQLTEVGFHALATHQGIDYLMKTYPPRR